MQPTPDEDPGEPQQSERRLSYKFQRLRERLRLAIMTGELSEKLPGERELARKFRVNAKTLGKALADLAAEGLLERRIGRGTFVRGSHELGEQRPERWVILCDPDQRDSRLVRSLCEHNASTQVVTDLQDMRPSLLNQVRTVVDLSAGTSDGLLRDLIVRNISVVLVGKQPHLYSVHAVLVDRSLAAMSLGRELMSLGHRRFVVVEQRGQSVVAEELRRTAARFAADVTVDPINPPDIPTAIDHGATAVVCGCRRLAAQVRDLLDARQIDVPGRVSLAAVGSGAGNYPCSGYYVHAEQKAETILHLIRDHSIKRPTTIWMTGTFHEQGTIGKAHALLVPAEGDAVRPVPGLLPSLARRDLAG